MPEANYTNLLSLLGGFYRQHENLPQFKKFWEGLIRTMDNEWLQLEQLRDAITMPFLPTYVRHSYLYRKITDWSDTGVFHKHFKLALRSTAGQKVYYLGKFVKPQETRVYLEGKELDPETEAYYVTYDQDTTQPGTNPRGSRLVFSQDIPNNSAIMVISDRETFWLDQTITMPIVSFSYGDRANVLSVRVKVDAQDITSQTAFNGAGTEIRYSAPNFTDPNSTDTRLFRVGEILRIVEPSGATTEITVLQDTQVVTLAVAVSISSSVFRVINLDVTPGRVVLEAGRISVPGQLFPANVSVRVRDAAGLQTFEITKPTSVVLFGRDVNIEEAEVTLLSGTIYNGITIGEDSIDFARAFQVGTRLHVRGDYHMLHDHASEFHQAIGDDEDTFWVPATRPMAVLNTGSGIIEDPELPIEVYVDGALIPKDAWIFLPNYETRAVRLVTTGNPSPVPDGTKVNVIYTDHEDNRLHKHIRDRYVSVDGQTAFNLSEPHDTLYPIHVMMDGFLQGDPETYGYADARNFLNIIPPIAGNVIVVVRGARLEYPYVAEVDTDIEAYMFAEEAVSPSRVVWAQTLQNGINTGDPFVSVPAQSGDVVLEEGFVITPVPSLVSGFTLKSSALISDAWLLEVDTDERTAWRNFGWLVDFDRETSEQYVRTVQALFAAYYKGSQRYTLENFTNLIMGASFLDAPATLTRIQEGREARTAIVTTLDDQSMSYELSDVVPDRVIRGAEMPKFHALTAYCKFMDLTAENFPWLTVAAADFSTDFSFAKSIDFQTPSIITGEDPTYDPVVSLFADETKDFVDGPGGTVWPGDLVEVVWTNASRGFGRVTEIVDRDTLRVRLDVPETLIPFGREAYGGGLPGRIHAYGGSRAQDFIDSYTIWARRIRRLDSHHFLDAMTPEEFAYVNSILVPLFDKFVSLIKFDWEGLYEGLLGDVKLFLDTAKGAASRYIAFSNVNGDEGLADAVGIELQGETVEVEIISNLFAIGLGAIDSGDPIGASIGVA